MKSLITVVMRIAIQLERSCPVLNVIDQIVILRQMLLPEAENSSENSSILFYPFYLRKERLYTQHDTRKQEQNTNY